MHFGGMMTHAQPQTQMMIIVMLLGGLLGMTVAVTVARSRIIILLIGLPLRVLFIFHTTILKPDFHLY